MEKTGVNEKADAIRNVPVTLYYRQLYYPSENSPARHAKNETERMQFTLPS